MALMFINWGIEARKWQLAVRKIEAVSFITSFKAVFTGGTLAFFTPNRIGEYLGRILFIKEGHRIQAISLTIICSLAQLMVTIAAGIASLVIMRSILDADPSHSSVIIWLTGLLYVSLAGGILLTILYFRLAWIIRWIEKIPHIEKFLSYIRVLDNFNATILLRILSLSVVRYVVFIVQYYLLFEVFSVGLNWWQAFWTMSVVFLVLAIIPTIAVFTDLGIRWKASVEMVQFVSHNTIGILATSLTIWVINLVIPALIGSLLILSIRLFRNK
jgi:hypothetical protein